MPMELFCPSCGTLEWRSYREPRLGPDQVRVEIEHAAAKQGTERVLYRGLAFGRGDYDAESGIFNKTSKIADSFRPFTPGNMVVGQVVAAGRRVRGLAEGDRILSPAGFRETLVLDADRLGHGGVRKLPSQVCWKTAVCLDPAMFGLAALRDGRVRIGDSLAVFGLGALGLMTVQLARLAGAHPIFGVDPIATRRTIAEDYGADLTFDPGQGDVAATIRDGTAGRGADVAIDFSGSAEGLQEAIRSVGHGGTVAAGSFPPPYEIGLDLGGDAHFNALNLVFTRASSDPNREHPRWTEQRIEDVCWRLACDGRISGVGIVQPVVPFDDLLTEYPRIEDTAATLKLGVDLGRETV